MKTITKAAVWVLLGTAIGATFSANSHADDQRPWVCKQIRYNGTKKGAVKFAEFMNGVGHDAGRVPGDPSRRFVTPKFGSELHQFLCWY